MTNPFEDPTFVFPTRVEEAGDGLKLLTFPDGFRVTPTSTLSAVIDLEGVPAIDLLKIDAEDDELDILEGISDAHRLTIHQIAAEIHSDGLMTEIRPLLAGQGFDVVSGAGISLTNTLYAVRR